jgi:O-antigen ligase
MTTIAPTFATPRVPPAWRLLLIGVMLVCGTVTLPQRIPLGGVSGLGALTILWCAGVWAVWLGRPYFPAEFSRVLLPLVLFNVLSFGSMLWYPPEMKGLQVLAVGAGFLGFVLVTARHVEESPGFAASIHRALDVGTAFAAAVYAASVVVHGMGTDKFIIARSLALFALLGVARQLARWQAGERGGLLLAALFVGVIFLSLSRTALVAALALFPIAALIRGDRRSWVTTVLLGALAAGALGAAVFLSETMYERFFGFDATLAVGGVNINASGRSDMWAFLLERAWESPIFGHGIGSSSTLVDQYFAPTLGHPHNDFLRFLYDLGLVGLALWLAFLGVTALSLWSHARRRARAGDATAPYFLAPLLALLAVAASMITDNTAGYTFVMAPLAILIGCALGLTRARSEA